MLVEIDKKDIIRLIRGTYPTYENMGMWAKLDLGRYVGGFADRWDWEEEYSKKWDKYSTKDLYDFYRYILKSDADSFVDTIISLGSKNKDDNIDK